MKRKEKEIIEEAILVLKEIHQRSGGKTRKIPRVLPPLKILEELKSALDELIVYWSFYETAKWSIKMMKAKPRPRKRRPMTPVWPPVPNEPSEDLHSLRR